MAKTQIKDYVFTPGIGAKDNLFPNAYSFLNANKTFIQKEATAWIADQVAAGAPGFVDYTYNQAKCERDIGYIIDAYLNDLRYGGNEKLYNTVKYYWDQDVAQVDGDRQPEIQTHTFIGTLITTYILPNTRYSASNQQVEQTLNFENIIAEEDATTKISTLVDTTVAVITNGLSSLPTLEPTGVSRLKFQGKHNLEELLLITNTTNNEIIYNFSNVITGGTVEFITKGDDSDFPKYLQTTDGITILTLNYNTSTHNSTDDIQIFVEKIENGKSVTTTRPFDFGTDAIERPRAAMPVSMLDADFEYGLQPTKWAAISTMRGYPSIYEIPGTDTPVLSVTTDASFGNTTEIFDIEVTNNSTNDYRIQSGTDRVGTLSGDDPVITVTEGDTITIVVNTPNANYGMYFKTSATHDNSTDLIPGVTGQGANSGQTISWTTKLGDAGSYYYLARSYGNMEGVITVVAGDQDAGVGQSQITVSTVGPHSLEPGDPFTIKAFEDSVSGAARAEGSFVVTTVPTSNTFTYFAKAKVGVTPGTVIANTYTQLRRAGFYTGANIGNPQYEVISNGQSGTIVTELAVETGSTIIPFDGITPEIGSTLSGNPAIGTDSQITGTLDTSAGGGEYLTVEIDGDAATVGATSIDVVDNSGIVPGLALDRGDGTAVYVTDINDNTVNISGPLTRSLIGNEADYIDVNGSNVSTIGSEVSLTIENTTGTYSIQSFQDAGVDYAEGDRLFVSGDLLGGSTPDNDLEMIVDTVVSDGSIETATLVGSGFTGVGIVTNVTPEVNGGEGSGAVFNVSYTDNVYNITLDPTDASFDFQVNDQLTIPAPFEGDGVSPTNDVKIKVTAVDGTGKITGFTAEGTAPDAEVTYPATPDYTTDSVAGTGLTFSVTRTGTIYSISIDSAGIDFVPGDTVTVAGNLLGGATPANDLTITVDNVGAAGDITASTVTGVAVNTHSLVVSNTVILLGSGFDISIALGSGAYSVSTINAAGSNYATGQTFNILGTDLLGASPANDVVVTIDTIDDNGGILGVSFAGVANDGNGVFAGIEPTNQQPAGIGASFDIVRDNDAYVVSLNATGSGYKVGNRIIITGPQLGGLSPLNDLEIKITGETTGAVDTFSTNFIEASSGSILRLLSTITISEPLTRNLSRNAEIDYVELATMEVTFPNAHGLVPGDTFISAVTSSTNLNNHDLASGSFIANDIPTKSSLRYQARADGTIDTSVNDSIIGEIYPRPDSFFIHRPYDGGVQLGTGGPQHGAQAIRQSKKYIRYQSGKGIMYTTGALFAPSYDLRSVTSDGVEVGSLITITTDDNDHGVQVGGVIRLLGIETPGYNSGNETSVPPEFDYTVTSVIDERTFTVRSQRRLGSTDAVLGFGSQMSVVSWHGATVRSGVFDDQNGIFWEYDGTNISVVQRTGTRQIAGTVSISVDSNVLTGTNTRFTDQLIAGDRIIIKGMTHVVSHVNSQSEITVTPDWRGTVDISGAKVNLVVDKKVKQQDFNLDRLDGTGPSGYVIDPAKMQMIGIQYSWYGAGFIDFMLRGQDGNFIFAHRMRNSNVNTEAFMRSGNLPVRYEVSNEGPAGKLASNMDASQPTIELVDSSFFPDSGTAYIDNEIITFTGNDKVSNILTGCTRAATFTNFQAGANRSYIAGAATTHTARTGVILISQTITPLISHWGSAFITDGGFDEDRGYIFSYSESQIPVSTEKQTAFMIRLAPSVSNALIGDLGERELLNRAQLLLQGLEVTSDSSTGGIVIEGVLNPQNYPINPSSVGWSGLQGLAQGGQPSFAQIAAGGSINWASGATTTNATINALPTVSLNLTQTNRDDDDRIRVRASEYQSVFGTTDVNAIVGANITHPNLNSGTIIRSYSGQFNDGQGTYYRYDLSSRASDDINVGETISISRGQNLTNRNFGYFTKATVDASGAVVGTQVTGGSVTFPANTQINRITPRIFGSTEYYEIQFNNSFSGTLSQSSGTVQLTFEKAAYAEPGETVFSFIANPGERSTLDLSELKELTNTPLGGRGTFPNGPDVLAINVYKVSGNTTNSNIILRWGEAQA